MNQEEPASKFSIRLVEQGIIENTVLKGSTLEAADAAWLKKANLNLAVNSPYCVLVEMQDLVIVSKEWQAITASSDFVQKTIAKAILVKNLAQSLVASFYLKFNKPAIKTRVFKNRQDAINWLRVCYQQNQEKNQEISKE